MFVAFMAQGCTPRSRHRVASTVTQYNNKGEVIKIYENVSKVYPVSTDATVIFFTTSNGNKISLNGYWVLERIKVLEKE